MTDEHSYVKCSKTEETRMSGLCPPHAPAKSVYVKLLFAQDRVEFATKFLSHWKFIERASMVTAASVYTRYK